MTGYVLLHCDCVVCHRLFSCNPLRVPSVRVNGVREPVCRSCVETANAQRVAAGLDPFPILPDAYDPVDESELPDDD